jgi:hypothetical protein
MFLLKAYDRPEEGNRIGKWIGREPGETVKCFRILELAEGLEPPTL